MKRPGKKAERRVYAFWWRGHPAYRVTLRIAKGLIREKLVDGWEAEALTSHMVRFVGNVLTPKPPKRKGGKPRPVTTAGASALVRFRFRHKPARRGGKGRK